MFVLAAQIITLDEAGLVLVWVAVQTARTNLSGSESDPGLLPGGCLRITLVSSIPSRLDAPPTVLSAPVTDTSRLLLGSQLGQVGCLLERPCFQGLL